MNPKIVGKLDKSVQIIKDPPKCSCRLLTYTRVYASYLHEFNRSQLGVKNHLYAIMKLNWPQYF